MASIKFLILGLFFVAELSWAGYAQLKPPPGWSPGLSASVPGQAGFYKFGAAANGASFRGGTVLTNAALNVAGQLITVPVGLRVAANAATVAAEYSFGNPLLFVAALGLPLAYKWYTDQGLSVKDGVWVYPVPGSCSVGCFFYFVSTVGQGPENAYTSAGAACTAAAASLGRPGMSGTLAGDTRCVIRQYSDSYNTWDIYKTPAPAQAATLRPVSKARFHEIADPLPVPLGVPEELPIPWPVELPVLEPIPLFVPTGNPVPTANPEIWEQPGVRVKPAPSRDYPWQVDLEPVNIPQNSPLPKSPGELNPVDALRNPDAKLGLCDQYPGIAACAPAAKPEDKTKFCEENPDVLACMKPDLDTPESDALETKDKAISITPDSGWGSDGGVCPAPRHFSHGDFSFQIYCDFASGIKPVVIAVAWLVAAGILIGFKFGES